MILKRNRWNKKHHNKQKPRTHTNTHTQKPKKPSNKSNQSKKYGNIGQFTLWRYAASLQHFTGKSVYRGLKKITEYYKRIFICIFYA